MLTKLPLDRPVIWAGLGNRSTGRAILQTAFVKALDGLDNPIMAADSITVEVRRFTHQGLSILYGVGTLKKIDGNLYINQADYQLCREDRDLAEILAIVNNARTGDLLEGCTFK